jgi:hypothetical protein
VDHGAPASYLTLEPGTEVLSSDGAVVGTVEHVLAAEDEDIFDGLVVDTKLGPGGHRFVDSEQVDEIYENAVVLTLSEAEAHQLPEPQPAPAAMDSEADPPPGPLEAKLRRAWDLISGNY